MMEFSLLQALVCFQLTFHTHALPTRKNYDSNISSEFGLMLTRLRTAYSSKGNYVNEQKTQNTKWHNVDILLPTQAFRGQKDHKSHKLPGKDSVDVAQIRRAVEQLDNKNDIKLNRTETSAKMRVRRDSKAKEILKTWFKAWAKHAKQTTKKPTGKVIHNGKVFDLTKLTAHCCMVG
ncbi:uncharacterized protein LOC106170033 [Lingula anatina]|uniref:Uncharacterized protein LOC106170033 n=1 Tax=Lingula anatina TaxID=7574 RepID=A0A1S3J435_LINAN|nr:uncharacterized protein LOC106170033 [Lingula anatina]|eukprot:XP_013405197.1 uncharacterized protein LOC106170033 [Lingula anatina]